VGTVIIEGDVYWKLTFIGSLNVIIDLKSTFKDNI